MNKTLGQAIDEAIKEQRVWEQPEVTFLDRIEVHINDQEKHEIKIKAYHRQYGETSWTVFVRKDSDEQI